MTTTTATGSDHGTSEAAPNWGFLVPMLGDVQPSDCTQLTISEIMGPWDLMVNEWHIMAPIGVPQIRKNGLWAQSKHGRSRKQHLHMGRCMDEDFHYS